jgi:hypothetical protein
MVAATGGEACPSCGASMAPDQRYCLACGSRRGEPRLPIMDAVVFMDAMRQPAASAVSSSVAPERQPRVSANASLVAGVATLVLAIGVGVMIGRSGDSGAASTAAATPQVIKVEGGGGGGAAVAEPTSQKAGGAVGGGSTKAAKAKIEAGSSGTSKAAEEVLKPAGDVKLPPPTTQVGEKCEKGTAGCSDSGEFNGSFFGE